MREWLERAPEILRLNSDWLWRVDADGVLTHWLATPAGDFAGLAVGAQDLGVWRGYLRAEAELRGNLRTLLRHVRAGEPFRCLKVGCVMPQSGLRGQVRISGVPLKDKVGAVTGYIGVAVNLSGAALTERKLGRVSRHASELELAMEASPIGLLIANPCGRGVPVAYANTSFLEMTGFGSREVIGRELFLVLGHQEDLLELQKLQALVARRQKGSVQLRLPRANGTLFWAEVSVTPNFTAACSRCSLVCVVRDVTEEIERRRVEQQRDRLQVLGQMAGGLAHEVNNLLQPASLFAEMLGDDIPADSPKRENVVAIQDALQQIQFIVRNTLRFSRQEAEGVRAPAPFAPMLSDRLAYLRTMIPATVSIETRGLEALSGAAAVSSTELTQVLSNLLNNAVQAMNGHGAIQVEARAIELDGVTRHRALPRGPYFELSVRDNGKGMAPEVAERIFEPFFTTKGVGEGTGLGLSVVYGIVTEWGGTIEVQSAPGRGACFSIFVPQAEAARVLN